MKYLSYVITILLVILTAGSTRACPACVGRLDKDAPPFFSPEYDAYCQHPTHSDASTTTAAAQKNEEKEKEKET